MLKQFDDTVTGRSLLETFVDPVIDRPKQSDDEDANSEFENKITIPKILESKKHTVIAFDHDTGGTSILKYLCMQYYAKCTVIPSLKAFPVVPALLDASRLKPYSANIASAIKGSLPETSDPSLKVQPLHDGGRLVLLVDEFDPGDEAHDRILKILKSEFPKARLIIAARVAPLLSEDYIRPDLKLDEFVFLHLKPFNRRRVRTLVEKWELSARYQTDVVVEEISVSFRALGIPLTAPYIAMYLSCLQEVNGFTPINSSTIIEQFVELVLEKYKPIHAFRSTFDYKNQIDYLAAIAEKMCEANDFIVDYKDVYDWTKEYFDSIGIDQDIPKLIQLFVDNKMFGVQANSISFKYNIFLSFFIGHRMTRSKEFYKWVFSHDTFHKFVNEIELYCGLSRVDLDALEFLAAEFQNDADQVSKILSFLGLDAPLEKLQLPHVDDREKFVDDISRQLLALDTTAEERDRQLEQGERSNNDVRPRLQRPEVRHDIWRWFGSLQAYTAALKNLENISREKKEEHLEKVLQGWSTQLRFMCLLLKQALIDQKIVLGDVEYKFKLPVHIDAQKLRFLFLRLPTLVSGLLRRHLGTEKLKLQLRRESPTHSIDVAFLRTGLYLDLKLTEYLNQLKALHRRLSESPFFLEALLVKLRDFYLRFGVAPSEKVAFRRLIAEIKADINGARGHERDDKISKWMADLNRDEQIQKLKDAAS
jgi:hypothetical protein